ncbi:hypothetical protein CP98_03655 [Sphingobium yanoikuyae]|uniref:Uncharacterized protein n=1 Tax=Sphingobium yanoikuyae TaxID=13690 RepID=A0A084EGR5_SPHYA|nr:hypothetical protein [Sphingobium yanoikuyae]KEZ17157.1 hypothetical protein CP98_03655 [Sphingobium yanoikuyae]
MIGDALAMGLSVSEVMGMTLHDYQAAIYHFNLQNAPEQEMPALDADEFDDMLLGLTVKGGA